MAAPLHSTEMAPVGTAGTVLGAVEVVEVAALVLVVVDSQGKPAAAVEAVSVAELPDAAVVRTSGEDVGGVTVGSSAVKHSVSIGVPGICTKNACRAVCPCLDRLVRAFLGGGL